MLDRNLLEREIRKINDLSYEEFGGFPQDLDETTERWSTAISRYAGGITPPSQSAESAKSSFSSTFTSLIQTDGNAAFTLSLTAYALELGLGMQPTFTAIPPPTPIILAPVFSLGFAGGSAKQCAELMSSTIDTWFKTGIAINNSSGATVQWG